LERQLPPVLAPSYLTRFVQALDFERLHTSISGGAVSRILRRF
jgi:hypothetical protein